MKLFFSASLLVVLRFFRGVYAHWDSAYFRNARDGFTDKSNWMERISDQALLSTLALPGTHDTATFNIQNDLLSDIAVTQVLNIRQQLIYGIRVFDLRIRHIKNKLAMHHGFLYLRIMLEDIMQEVAQFLDTYPSETVLLSLNEEAKAADNTRSLEETVAEYFDLHPGRYLNITSKLTLGQARGKFVLLPGYGEFSIQDNFHLRTNWDLYSKWESIKSQLELAYHGKKGTFYVNYLSGSGGSFPYFVASGHVSSGTAAGRLLTGLTTPGWNGTYPDFPRVGCFLGVCSIAFEGTNILTRDYLSELNARLRAEPLGSANRAVGIIMCDFPGESLISSIIENNNYFNNTINRNFTSTTRLKHKEGETDTVNSTRVMYGKSSLDRAIVSGTVGLVQGIVQAVFQLIKEKNPQWTEGKLAYCAMEFARIMISSTVNSFLTYAIPPTKIATASQDNLWPGMGIYFAMNLSLEVLSLLLANGACYINNTSLRCLLPGAAVLSNAQSNRLKKIIPYLFVIYFWVMIFFSDNQSEDELADKLLSILFTTIMTLLGHTGVKIGVPYMCNSEKNYNVVDNDGNKGVELAEVRLEGRFKSYGGGSTSHFFQPEVAANRVSNDSEHELHSENTSRILIN